MHGETWETCKFYKSSGRRCLGPPLMGEGRLGHRCDTALLGRGSALACCVTANHGLSSNRG